MRLNTCRLAAPVILLLLLAPATWAATITVKADGTGNYSTVQAAIDAAAASGDEIVLQPGTYTGPGNRDITTGDKSLTIRGTNALDQAVVAATIIDCQGTAAGPHRGFDLTSGITPAVTISGLTITNGCANQGGAIECNSWGTATISRCVLIGNSTTTPPCRGGAIDGGWKGSVILRDCTFIANRSQNGGAVASDATLTMSNCTFRGNVADEEGGGLWLTRPSSITTCIFDSNAAPKGAAIVIDQHISPGGTTAFTNCIVRNNIQSGTDWSCQAIYLGYDALASFTCCTLTHNARASDSVITAESSASLTLSNCIVWTSQSTAFSGTGQIAASYCDIGGGYAGTGNINADPLLTYDGHLQPGSPCINAGTPTFNSSLVPKDINNQRRVQAGRIDIGADEWFDTDADTLPDWWETKYFGSFAAADPAQDNSGYGLTNRQKYLQGVPGQASTLYVSAVGGNDGYDGRSAAYDGTHGPKATIQSAATASVDGSVVIVQPGTYTGNGNRDIRLWGKIINVRGSDPLSAAVVAATVIDCQGTIASPHRAFSLTSGETPGTTISGLTITGGWATDSDPVGDYPGGGAIRCLYATPTISRCTLTSNKATSAVAALYPCGGAIQAMYGRPTLQDCTFTANEAASGGAVSCTSGATIDGCTFRDNVALPPTSYSSSMGGGAYLEGDPIKVTNCLFESNRAYTGGGLLLSGGFDVTMTNCRISRNQSVEGGAGIHCIGLYPVIANCLITHNTCTCTGGAGGLFVEGAQLTLRNSTLALNSSPALYTSSYSSNGLVGHVSMENCIVWGLTATEVQPTARTSATRCDVAGGLAGEGNINIDPLLTWDGHLQAASPCINAGDPAFVPAPGETDIDGQPRVIHGRVDIGADEYTLAGDVNGDGTVDPADLLTLADSWARTRGQPAYDGRCDLNGDDSVDVVDLLMLAESWGQSL